MILYLPKIARMIYFFPLIAALAGWLLNKILVFFFLNHKLPRLREPIADAAAQYALKEIDLHKIAVIIADTKNISPLLPAIEAHVEVLLREKIKEKIPVLAALMGDKTINKIKTAIMEELALALPKLIIQLGDNVKIHVRIEEAVRDKIRATDIALLKKSLQKPIQYIELAGVFSGFLIGLILLLLMICNKQF